MQKKDIDWGSLGFSYMPTDYRFVANFKDGKWSEGELTEDATITMTECAGVLQYAQTCFEGLKAYTTEDGKIVCFRPDLNASRMADSCKRLEMPVFPEDKFIEAVKICEQINPNIDFYDVNMGCPVNKVTKTGAGSALLKDPVKCGKIIKAIKSVTNKPVSAKIRLGWDKNSINFLEVIDELEKAGIDLIAIHARTTKDLYIGTPKYELIQDLRDKIHVPLVVSGNIYKVEDAINALNITKADAVMVARGGVGNPRLITNINNYINNKEIKYPSLHEQIDYCEELAKMICEEFGEKVGMRIFRSIGSKFFNGFPNCKELKQRITTETFNYDDLEMIIEEYLQEYSDQNYFDLKIIE